MFENVIKVINLSNESNKFNAIAEKIGGLHGYDTERIAEAYKKPIVSHILRCAGISFMNRSGESAVLVTDYELIQCILEAAQKHLDARIKVVDEQLTKIDLELGAAAEKEQTT